MATITKEQMEILEMVQENIKKAMTMNMENCRLLGIELPDANVEENENMDEIEEQYKRFDEEMSKAVSEGFDYLADHYDELVNAVENEHLQATLRASSIEVKHTKRTNA